MTVPGASVFLFLLSALRLSNSICVQSLLSLDKNGIKDFFFLHKYILIFNIRFTKILHTAKSWPWELANETFKMNR